MYPSGRVTIQNRKFIRKVNKPQPSPEIIPSASTNSQIKPPDETTPMLNAPTVMALNNPIDIQPPPPTVDIPTITAPNHNIQITQPTRVSRALRNLQDFNKPGLRETMGQRR